MIRRFVISFTLASLPIMACQPLKAQGPDSTQVEQLEKEVKMLRSEVSDLKSEIRDSVGGGIVLFLFAGFCALWAQNTGRNPWLWFFLGACFSIITVIVLLNKNSNDRKASAPSSS